MRSTPCLIDDARTPLIISGPIPKGDDQMLRSISPMVERLYEVQRKTGYRISGSKPTEDC
jgi:preprotein translocase subunit SecA